MQNVLLSSFCLLLIFWWISKTFGHTGVKPRGITGITRFQFCGLTQRVPCVAWLPFFSNSIDTAKPVGVFHFITMTFNSLMPPLGDRSLLNQSEIHFVFAYFGQRFAIDFEVSVSVGGHSRPLTMHQDYPWLVNRHCGWRKLASG